MRRRLGNLVVAYIRCQLKQYREIACVLNFRYSVCSFAKIGPTFALLTPRGGAYIQAAVNRRWEFLKKT